jgi:hypothetical protein
MDVTHGFLSPAQREQAKAQFLTSGVELVVNDRRPLG